MSAPTFGVSSGLLDPRHVAAMGPAWAEFLLLLDRQTDADGTVNGGRPLLIEEIAQRTGRGSSTTRRNLARLEAAGYIAKRQSGAGLIVSIMNPKKRFKARPEIAQKRAIGSLKSERSETGEIAQNRARDSSKVSDHSLYKEQNSKEGSTPKNGAPLFGVEPLREEPPKLTPYRAVEVIAEAGGLELTRPLPKDLKQAKALVAASITEADIRLTVAHLLEVNPGWWNVKRPIDPAAIVEHLPIAKKAKATTAAEPDLYAKMTDRSRYFGHEGDKPATEHAA